MVFRTDDLINTGINFLNIGQGEIIFSGPLLDIDSSGPQVLSSFDLEEIIDLLDLA